MNELRNAKVGDKIFVGRGSYDRRLATVTKVGKVHLTSSEGLKYSLDSGRRAGKSIWTASWATIATEKDILEWDSLNQKRSIVSLMGHVDWSDQSLETLEAVLALVNKKN